MPSEKGLAMARECLRVPGFNHHWIPEHYEASVNHVAALLDKLEAEARLEEATLWDANTTPHNESTHEWSLERIKANIALITATVNALPQLLDERDALEVTVYGNW